MVQKRFFAEEELFNVPAKHPRQLERNNELVPYLEFVPSDPALQQPLTSDRTEGVEKLCYDTITELPAFTEDMETSVPGCLSISSWTSSTSEDDVRPEVSVRTLFSPGNFNSNHPMRTIVRSEDMYSLLLVHAPHKPVPIGKDYQANIPTWNPQGTANTSNLCNLSEPVLKDSDSELALDNDDEKKLMGVCIIPMPDSATFALNAYNIATGKTDCRCHDNGSVRCIRQHITEAREELRRTLGQEKFLELGFSDMGEEVAEKWSDDEEQLFHEVVFCNPASLGRNFWDNLSVLFPSRANKDIVSYYFNVFMLRKRAEQNRCDRMNIDSDNDEWQGSDDYNEAQLGMRDEDEDSVVESPVYEDDPGYERSLEGVEFDEDGIDETYCNNGNVNFDASKGLIDVPEACIRKRRDSHGSDLACQLSEKTLWKERDDQDVQDDSCTSFDTGAAMQGLPTKAESGENSNHWRSNSYSLNSGGGSHGYVLEPSDAKVWDSGYMTCPKNEIDFLPTCNMIEEVFEDGDWNLKARDMKDLF